MDFKTYQKECRKTAIYLTEPGRRIIYPTLGLCGESGEVAEKVKKLLRDKNGSVDDEFLKNIEKELGDVMWYISSLASDLGIDLDNIASNNISKLKSRKERGVIHGSGDTR